MKRLNILESPCHNQEYSITIQSHTSKNNKDIKYTSSYLENYTEVEIKPKFRKGYAK